MLDKLKSFAKKFSEWNYLNIFTGFLLILIFCLVILISNTNYFKSELYSYKYIDSPPIPNIEYMCGDWANDIDKIYCIRDEFVSPFYIRRANNDSMSPRDLKFEGGDCSNWAYYYKVAMDRLNIKSKIMTTDSHMFTIAYGDDYYCILDQTMVTCQELI